MVQVRDIALELNVLKDPDAEIWSQEAATEKWSIFKSGYEHDSFFLFFLTMS